MSTDQNPPSALIVRAEYIGPIFSLDQELSANKQNLIFAKNGVGKSFIARAIRFLDPSMAGDASDSEICRLLVSEESATGKALFELKEGDSIVGGLVLNQNEGTVERSDCDYIFHVFSGDYVNEQVHERLEDLDGEITHEIIIGKENQQLDDLERTHADVKTRVEANRASIEQLFGEERERHKSDFEINASLGEYRSLKAILYFGVSPFLGDPSVPSLSEAKDQYSKFRSMPLEPELPAQLRMPALALDDAALKATLLRITSPSTVADDLREQISRNPIFYEKGLHLYSERDDQCPFCTQSLSSIAQQVIAEYSRYFSDKEAQEIRLLNTYKDTLLSVQKMLIKLKSDCAEVDSKFNKLKDYFPSLANRELENPFPAIEGLARYADEAVESVHTKLQDLKTVVEMPSTSLAELEGEISAFLERNNVLIAELAMKFGDSTSDRIQIQNLSCKAFAKQFFADHRTAIDEIRDLSLSLNQLSGDIQRLQQEYGKAVSARERIVRTFSALLVRFFHEKYSFDEKSFRLKHNDELMRRGADRTISDGEKSVIAFCYFLAQIHLRVQSNLDYKKLYLVIDDPVTSLSFDFVYSVVQCLKYLRIDEGGEIRFNLDSAAYKPKALILTHNHYFLNVANSNNLVKETSLFQLIPGPIRHQLNNQRAFATAHLLQLRDLAEVSGGKKRADHTTANSIRSVVESMWRFCRPDLASLNDFLNHLIEEFQIEIESVLMNDLSHGGKFDSPFHCEDDIRQAAGEAIKVVELYAPGQTKDLLAGSI